MPLLPLAQGEILGTDPGFLHTAYTGRFSPPRHPVLGPELVERVLASGLPEALARPQEHRRQDWARSYVSSVLTRDLRDIAAVEKLTDLPRFVRILAEHSGQLVNFSRIAAAIGVSYQTAQRYVGLLEQVFLVATLDPWYTNRVKRLIKTPKLHFLDPGLLSSSLGLTTRATAERRREAVGNPDQGEGEPLGKRERRARPGQPRPRPRNPVHRRMGRLAVAHTACDHPGGGSGAPPSGTSHARIPPPARPASFGA